MPDVTTVSTGDGTATLFVPSLNEHYHSIHGAVRESLHVFIHAGLQEVNKDEIQILEVGFGTGLNALLTLSLTQKPIIYHAIEFHPLSNEIIQGLNYAENDHDQSMWNLIHEVPWEDEYKINELFRIKKIQVDLLLFNSNEKYDLIYFDAFGPNVQPELWTKEIFKKMFDLLNPNGILVTYSAKGELKRNLKECGFEVETLPGPPGKREMTRGRRNS